MAIANTSRETEVVMVRTLLLVDAARVGGSLVHLHFSGSSITTEAVSL